jgi:type I restriction enzyme S subunit
VSVETENLPVNWAIARVSDLFDVVGGGTPSTEVPEYWHGETPWISSADVDERHQIMPRRSVSEAAIKNSATNRVAAGSVIVVTRVGLGKVGITDTPICFSQDSQALVFNQEFLFPKYVLFYMGTAVQIFKRIGRGTTISGVTKKQLRELEFRLPPLSEQKRIVAEIEKQFTRLEAAVTALKRVQANLKRYRAAVLKAACEGRLVPTEAELARREGRSYEPASNLLKCILAERCTRWEAAQLAKFRRTGKTPQDTKWKHKYQEPLTPEISQLAPLPEGWVWASWKQIGFSQNGRAFPSSEYRTEGVKLLRPGNLHASGRVVWSEDNTRCLQDRWATEFPEFIVLGGELVMNLTAQSLKDEFLGRVCITGASDRCLLNQRIARLTPVEVGSKYLLWMFKSSVFRRYVNELNTGSLIQHMFTSQLDDFPLPLPPLAEQTRIVAEIERRMSVIDEIELQLEVNVTRAERLRQSILKRAFEGKLFPQDPRDESASILLERIRGERDASIRAKPISSEVAEKARSNRRSGDLSK